MSPRFDYAVRYGCALAALAVLGWSVAAFVLTHLPVPVYLALLAGATALGVLLDLRPRWALAVAGLGLLATPLAARYAPGALDKVWELLAGTFALIRDGWMRRLDAVPPGPGQLVVFLAISFFALVFHGWGIRRRRPWVPLTTGVAWMSLQWLMMFEPTAGHLSWFLLAGLALVAATFSTGRPSTGFLSSRPPAGATGPVVAAVVLLMVVTPVAHLLPRPSPTWTWGRLGDLVVEAFPMFEELRGPGRYGAGRALSGLSWGYGTEVLGGPLALSDQPVLRITFDTRPTWPLYLREQAISTYTGRGWIMDEGTGQKRDAGEPLALLAPGNRSANRLVHTITLLDLPGRYLPAVYDPIRVDVALSEDTNKNLAAHQPPGRNASYRVISYQPWVSQQQLLEWPLVGLPEEYQVYLQLPAVPRDVYELARKVVEGVESPYARALAVEGYLRHNYPYDLAVPPPRAGRDFVAYFLLELKRGYCTYHATAMVVMLRAVGIPARWVQGFRLDEPQEFTGELTVTRAHAHAWVEAYFPGYGWVLFEPTPAHALPQRDAPAPELDGPVQPATGAERPAPGLPEDPDWSLDPDHPAGTLPGVQSPATWAPALVVVVLALLTGWRIAGLQRVRGGGAGRAYELGLCYLAALGVKKSSCETVEEFAARVEAARPDLAAGWRALAAAYTVVTYAPDPGPLDAGELWADLRRELRAGLGPGGYAWTTLVVAWAPARVFR